MNDDSDNDLGKYFEMDCDNSFSYGNENQDINSLNLINNDYPNEENNTENKKSNQIDDYLYNNLNINNNILSNNNEINNSNLKEKEVSNNNKIEGRSKNNNFINNTINDETNINNFSFKSNLNTIKLDNSNDNISITKKSDDDLENVFFPKTENKNIIYNSNNTTRVPNNKEDGKSKKLDESLSSSSSEIKVISSEDFRRHFQEDKYGPQRTIEVIPTDGPKKIPFSQYHDKLNDQKSLNKNNNNGFDAFFMDDKKVENNSKINKNKNKNKNCNLIFSPKKTQKNKNNRKKKKFSPLPKDKYRDNKKFQKLLINRLEKQILTDIYNEYDNKDDFDETYYHLDKLKYILNEKGVDQAMNYLESLEPESFKRRIIIESTFFFKEIIKEEVEFAKVNNNTLILYKQPDHIFSQNMKYNIPLSGKLNQTNDFIKKGKSIRFNEQKFNCQNDNEYNSFYNSLNVFSPSKNINYKK